MKTIQYKNQYLEVSKVVCIGRNYVAHIEELGNEIPSSMVVFNKPNSAISDTLYYFSEHCRYEGEICFLIRDAKIDGIGFGLDLTHADIQNHLKSKSLPWERAKAFDHSAVLSEFINLDVDISTLKMKLYINNKLVQFATYDLMMYKPDTMLSEIQSFMTLDDNDIIMSGTPKGVGNYSLGDKFVGQIFSGELLLLEKEWIVKSLKD
ncbi:MULTISPECIES: fumarylacetoacetate hydrolase family protein [Sulfurovum]|uniref:Fumarylacetoacetate hydrolase family protein n=1 Tax=Sulfurovum xiamenensis TaxID=3019066 RepID=A0ABT7QR94_9BACT|nr:MULTISPECIES: fumarylacetoacetate hydrolase family protein [Sulfurovum]EIF51763.1 fumarylacetoacetate hydrolase [Sulfurovum sp. AR]MDM5263399.1 fumarylacetoacetate hydrolase family protein [Sulfurovum xiamenensis]